MLINPNFQLLEQNMCPGCMSPFIKTGIGYDRGIHCNNCGFETPVAKYREVMQKMVSKKLAEKDDD